MSYIRSTSKPSLMKNVSISATAFAGSNKESSGIDFCVTSEEIFSDGISLS